MRAPKIVAVAVAGVFTVAAAACGDDGVPPPDAGVTAADYEGTWLMSSITFPGTGGGPPATIYRNGGDETLRGDVVFAPTGATTGTLSVRQALLQGGLLAGEVMSNLLLVTVEPDRWVLTPPDDKAIVFTTARDGDHLVLSADATDPRHQATDAPSTVVVDRVAPWSTTVAGSWELVSLEFVDRTITAGVCTAVQTGAMWATFRMPITFTPRLLFERQMIVTGYSDPQCTVQTSTQTSTQSGLAEEEGDTTLRLWGLENDDAEHLTFTMSLAGDTATLTRTSCLPLPGCETDAPVRVVVRRAP